MTPRRLAQTPHGRECAGMVVLHEDARLLVIDKPAGLLSQPGVRVHDSVSARAAEARPDAERVALVHRLDMDTSGVLVLAKDAAAHRALGAQFERRTVAKRYRALLERPVAAAGGIVALALRADLDDRPRQIVDAALDESAHVVGLSILSGSHLALVRDVIDAMRAEGLGDIPLVVGGIIPDADADALRAYGVARVYTPKDFELNRIMLDIVALVGEAPSRAA